MMSRNQRSNKTSFFGTSQNKNTHITITCCVCQLAGVIAGEHTISTPGTIDTHLRFVSSQKAIEVICSGTTGLRPRLILRRIVMTKPIRKLQFLLITESVDLSMIRSQQLH